MEIGQEYEIIRAHTLFPARVRIIREFLPDRWVGELLTDLPYFSAGGQTAIEPEDVALDV